MIWLIISLSKDNSLPRICISNNIFNFQDNHLFVPFCLEGTLCNVFFLFFYFNQFEIFALLLNLSQCHTFSKIVFFLIFNFQLFVDAIFFANIKLI